MHNQIQEHHHQIPDDIMHMITARPVTVNNWLLKMTAKKSIFISCFV